MALKTDEVKHRSPKQFHTLGLPAVLLILLVTGGGCREIYYPDEILSAERIPVIQGLIHENEEPLVKLTWALGYGDKVAEVISNANVSISDDAGNSVDLEENVAGTYSVDAGTFTGVRGRSYTLSVVLEDGNQYVSNSVPMLENTFSDSIYGEPGPKDLISYGVNNQPVIETQEGLEVYADVYMETETPKYYRFSAKVTQEMSYTIDLGSLSSRPVYLWRSYMLGNSYAVGRTATKGTQQVLLRKPMGFLRYYYDSNLETETSTAPYTDAWVIILHVYAISSDVYHYYNSISKQLISTDQIFAPDPSQVSSNISCLNDPAKKVIGVFEVSSSKTIYKAFSWVNQERYKSKDLVSFPPDVSGGSQETFAPDFWIFF